MSRQGVWDIRYPVGAGYITIPPENDTNRDDYIRTCFNRQKLSIITTDFIPINNCMITRSAIKDITFPQTPNLLGSAVVYVNDMYNDTVMIVGVLNNSDSELLIENEFRLNKRSKNGSVNISGNAKNTAIYIDVNSETDEDGNLTIDVRNKSNTSKVLLKVSGDIDIEATGDINIYSNSLNIDSVSDVKVDSDSLIQLGKENLEPAVKGDKLKKLLDDILTEISKITVSTAIGIQPIINKVEFTNLQQRTDEYFSQLNKLE